MKYDIYIRHPFFKHRHELECNSIEEALQVVKSRYVVTDEKMQNVYRIASAWENGEKVIEEQLLF